MFIFAQRSLKEILSRIRKLTETDTSARIDFSTIFPEADDLASPRRSRCNSQDLSAAVDQLNYGKEMYS